jgi:hypothetical protein
MLISSVNIPEMGGPGEVTLDEPEAGVLVCKQAHVDTSTHWSITLVQPKNKWTHSVFYLQQILLNKNA